jgi:hypothetical protein
MYEYLTIEECKKQLAEKSKGAWITSEYQLCYVERVDKEIWDYTPESKEFMKNDQQYLEYEKQIKEKFDRDMKEFGHAHFEQNPLQYKVKIQFYPNPELEKGEYIAYFTPIPLDKQWGDDWEDAPYEHNAECPYGDYWEGDEKIEYTIKCIYFTPKVTCMLPEDYSFGGNSPFCVRDINAGVVAWLFNGKKAIYAGCGLLTFLKEIEDF